MRTTMQPFTCLALLIVSQVIASVPNKPRAFRGWPTINEWIRRAGYGSSNYLVKTEDSYYIWLHRIGNNTGTPILIQHGLANTAEVWVVRGRNKDLAYFLADEGYDVYLSNFRGNVYNDGHDKYKRSDPRFWDFSFHENGYYDLAAMYDKVLELTGKKQLIFIGHSQGVTSYLVLASARPEYNKKTKAAILLSPVAYFDRNRFRGLFEIAVDNSQQINDFIVNVGLSEVLPRTEGLIRLISLACNYKSIYLDLCLDIYGFLLGENRGNCDKKSFANHLISGIGGSSIRSYNHFAQLFRNNDFTFYNYGPEKNMQKYNSPEPPPYPLEKITAPVAMFWSGNDRLAPIESVKRLTDKLPNVILVKKNPDRMFNHGDVYNGLNANQTLYCDIIRLIRKVDKKSKTKKKH